jgi:hypothetical protein
VCRESWVAAHIGAPAKNRKLSCMSTRTHSKTSMVLHLSPQAKKTIDFCCFCERGSTPQKERNGESVCDFSCTLVLVRGCCFALKCLFQCRLVRWQRELFFFFFFFSIAPHGLFELVCWLLDSIHSMLQFQLHPPSFGLRAGEVSFFTPVFCVLVPFVVHCTMPTQECLHCLTFNI